MNFLDRLKARWKLKSITQVWVVLLCFALTGFSILFLKHPILNLFSSPENRGIGFSIAYYILILPIYNLVLLFWGSVFGQFKFFWEFEKKMFRRMIGKK